MIYEHDLVNGTEDDLLVIGKFPAAKRLPTLEYPYSSVYTSTETEGIHPTVVGYRKKEMFYLWDSREMKMLPNNGHSSKSSSQTSLISHKSPGSPPIRNRASFRSNEQDGIVTSVLKDTDKNMTGKDLY